MGRKLTAALITAAALFGGGAAAVATGVAASPVAMAPQTYFHGSATPDTYFHG